MEPNIESRPERIESEVAVRKTAMLQSGRVPLGQEISNHWNLHEGEGSRTFKSPSISFEKEFPEHPEVLVFLTGQDICTKENLDLRIASRAVEIDEKGFRIEVSTWKDSKIYAATISWLAFISSPDHPLFGGTLLLNKQTANYNLAHGKGDRKYISDIPFPSSFQQIPNLFVGFSMLDIITGPDCRITVVTNNETTNGFKLEIGTWQDSLIWSCKASWFAFDSYYSLNNEKNEIKILNGRVPWKKEHPNYNLLKGKGPRGVKRRIQFSKKMMNPSIITSIAQLDIISPEETNHRFITSSENIDPNGFDHRTSTWDDCQVWSCSSTWLAFSIPNADPADLAEPESTETPVLKKSKVEKEEGSDSTKQGKEEKPADESNECKVCMDNLINTVLVPCGHMCVCLDCSALITGQKPSLCPICKQKIQKVVKTFHA